MPQSIPPESKRTFWDDFRRFFFRGIATLLPTVLTIVLMVKGYEFIQNNIGAPITEGVVRVTVSVMEDYPRINDQDLLEFISETKPVQFQAASPEGKKSLRLWKLRRTFSHAPGSWLGFMLAIIVVYIVGRLLASYIGHKIWGLFEKNVQQVPGFKQVYPHVKQVTDYLFGENRIEFSRVVALPYPRKGVWSLGLVTGAGFSYMAKQTDRKLLTVFVPSSPTPFTGYVVHIDSDEVIDLPITIEEAMRFTVSGGVIIPRRESLPGQQAELKAADPLHSPTQDQKEEGV